MEDGDGCFDLDDLKYSFDFGESEGVTTPLLPVVTGSSWKWESDQVSLTPRYISPGPGRVLLSDLDHARVQVDATH